MSISSYIPKGYRLHVHLDYLPNAMMSNHQIFEGLTREDAAFRVELGNLMSKDRFVGMLYEPTQRQKQNAHDRMLPIFEKHKHLFTVEQMEQFKSDFGAMCDVVADKLTGPSPEGYYLLHVDGVTLQEVPENIVFNDVTNNFNDLM